MIKYHTKLTYLKQYNKYDKNVSTFRGRRGNCSSNYVFQSANHHSSGFKRSKIEKKAKIICQV